MIDKLKIDLYKTYQDIWLKEILERKNQKYSEFIKNNALFAAALPHWFNAKILSVLLQNERTSFELLYDDLKKLNFIESFKSRGGHNVHEEARAVILNFLWFENKELYIEFSRRATELFGEKEKSEWRIEHIYHLLIYDNKKGIKLLKEKGDEWYKDSKDDQVNALAKAALEHVHNERLKGVGEAYAHYFSGITNSNKDNALNELKEAIKGEVTQLLKANSNKAIGDIHHNRGDHKRAINFYEKALQIYCANGDKEGEANTIKAIGDANSGLQHHKVAIELYNNAVKIFGRIGNTKEQVGMAECYRSMGDAYYWTGKFPDAERCFKMAINIFENIKGKIGAIGQAKCKRSLGDIYKENRNYDDAITCYREALLIDENNVYKKGEANCNKDIGDVFLRLNDFNKARQYFDKALETYLEIEDKSGEATCIKFIGDVHSGYSEYESALGKYKDALKTYQKIKDKLGEFNCIKSEGDIYLKRNMPDEAINCYNKALDFKDKVDNKSAIASAFKSMGIAYAKKGMRDKANDYYKKASKIYKDIGAKLEEDECNSLID